MIEAENGMLYTGITKDVERRFSEHQGTKKGAKFFRSSPPKKIRLKRGRLTLSQALKLEILIKKLKRSEKLALRRIPSL